jgi:hypothetical protein
MSAPLCSPLGILEFWSIGVMGYMKFSIFSKDLKTAKMPNILKTKLQAATTWVNFRKFWLLVALGPPATAVYERDVVNLAGSHCSYRLNNPVQGGIGGQAI